MYAGAAAILINVNPTHSNIFHNSSSCRRLRFHRISYKLFDHHIIKTERRSGAYPPALWNFHSIQALNTNDYKEERQRVAALIGEVKVLLLQEQEEEIRRLELIDDLQRLGISCHFDNEITHILNSVNFNNKCLYTTALGFRLLRQSGVAISQEVFDCFKNEEGNDFKRSLFDDTKGLLQLYEASFLATQGEETLEIAKEFCSKFLQKKVDLDDKYALAKEEFPIHWRVQMPNARSFIDAYKRRSDSDNMNPAVLELAILDFNIVQAQFQQELKEASRWWNKTGLAQHLPFVRDRIVECYFWTTGVVERRQHGYERIMLTKINALVTTIDDIFDIYGTLEELQLFTNAIQRWDVESMEQLPPYMQLCYLALHNFVNESAYDTLKEKGFNSIPYLRKTWVDLVEAYMREAEWYYNGHKPSMAEYINNGWISIGGVPILSHMFFRLTDSIKIETSVESLHKYHDMVRASSTILRLADDLGTSLDEVERGDVPKSVECYMNEQNCSEEDARKHVRRLIEETWKAMNREMTSDDSPFSKYLVEVAANLARMAQYIYQQECDGFGMQHSLVNKMLCQLLFHSYT